MTYLASCINVLIYVLWPNAIAGDRDVNRLSKQRPHADTGIAYSYEGLIARVPTLIMGPS